VEFMIFGRKRVYRKGAKVAEERGGRWDGFGFDVVGLNGHS